MKKICIIGSGFSALSAACYLAKAGYRVDILEKNHQTGGRARQLKANGFTFDMGPTWYWMPDVFDRFFQDFGKETSDYYQLDKLSPGYRVVFGAGHQIDVFAEPEKLNQLFEEYEKGSSKGLNKFLNSAENNYDVAIKDLVYKPGESFLELVSFKTIKKLSLFFTSIRKDVQRKIKNSYLKQILEFPVLFLGSKPQNTPAFYSFMNHADLSLGTWYPKGGMRSVVDAIEELAIDLGVTIRTNFNIDQILVENNQVVGVKTGFHQLEYDIVLSGADYHHTEQLLPLEYRQYSEAYWSKRTFAPSSLLFYVGVNKKLDNLKHHMLFFDQDFDEHAKSIYDNPGWPKNPLFYMSCSSLTDKTAPEGMENLVFLIPLAIDIEDTESIREEYFNHILERFERLTGNNITKNDIEYYKSYCVNDFKKDYNAYGGNAYGLANILTQTAFLRPKIQSKKLKNLFFTGQLTVPGPGVPPALISGKLAADMITKKLPL